MNAANKIALRDARSAVESIYNEITCARSGGWNHNPEVKVISQQMFLDRVGVEMPAADRDRPTLLGRLNSSLMTLYRAEIAAEARLERRKAVVAAIEHCERFGFPAETTKHIFLGKVRHAPLMRGERNFRGGVSADLMNSARAICGQPTW